MADKKRPRRTRERILETALALFNRHGEPSVTTAHIADEMNISPGNLYYHFRNKDEIIGELYAAYEAQVLPLFAAPPDRPPGVEDLWLLLHLLFERMWTSRFLFRDLDELASRNRRLANRFAELVRRGETTVIKLCEGMVAAGTMHATAREIAALARNVALVATYWLSFQRFHAPAGPPQGREPPGGRLAQIASGGSHSNPASAVTNAPRLDLAAYQVLALVAPFMTGEARMLIGRLGDDYLQGG